MVCEPYSVFVPKFAKSMILVNLQELHYRSYLDKAFAMVSHQDKNLPA